MSLTLRLIERWTHPERIAVKHGTLKVSYQSLTDRIYRAAGWLEDQGIGPGNVVALQMPKSLAFLELHLALLALGAITLPLNDRYTSAEVSALVADADASLAIVPQQLGDRLAVRTHDAALMSDVLGRSRAIAELRPISPDAVGVLCYTSGTTGRAKGALILQRNIEATVQSLHEGWRWSNRDILLHTLPLYHVHGLFVAQHGALRAGATSIWLNRFDADDVLQTIANEQVSILMGVPTHYYRLLQSSVDQADIRSIRLFTSGSAPLPATVHRAFAHATGHEVVERYGMTEIGIVLSNPLDGPRKPGAVGVPLPGAQARIVDRITRTPLDSGQTGEVEIAGPSVFSGYLGRPKATADALVNGWMRTGDLGFVDPDGWFHLVGRTSEMMITGGFNVYPAEIEAALSEQPGILEVAVFGIPDDDLGERVCAAIVSTQPLVSEQLRTKLKTRLAAYKVPRSFFRVDELPRNTMGKVLKRKLTSLYRSTALR